MPQDDNAAQAEFWNARPGQNWVTFQSDLDAMHEAVNALLVEVAAPRSGERVLDIGCGAGASSFALAGEVAPSGHVLGVDISAPLVARAEERRRELGLDGVEFVVADAQSHRFEPGRSDLAASRFGLMFFSDPVAAFRNIAAALRPGGRLAFAAWDRAEDNPWFVWPLRVAEARLGAGTPQPPDAPGPLAFRDRFRVAAILEAAGFADAAGESRAVELHHPGGLEAVMRLAAQVGPVARLVREKAAAPEDVAAIAEATAAEFARFRTADGIRIPARVNLFTARRT
jgi:SAM-dependent methyltransferase